MTKVIHELYDVDPQSLRDRLEVIVKDEEMHQEPLATIVRILGPREQQQEESKPIVRYQNPDSQTDSTICMAYNFSWHITRLGV